MDLDRERRNRTIRVVVADSLIAFSVITIVGILLAVVIGYRVNANLSLEQNGLVQIKSQPTGAMVAIDDDALLVTTDLSRMLPGGEHELVLQHEGYEEWRKTIRVTPGWLLRIHYPRLFKQNRKKRDVVEFETANLDFFYASPDRKYVLYSDDSTTKWHLLSGFGGTVKSKIIDVAGIFSTEAINEDDGYDFTGKIKSIEWNDNDTMILVAVNGNDGTEWGVINFDEPTESVNISRELTRYTTNAEQLEEKDKEAKKKTSDNAETPNGKVKQAVSTKAAGQTETISDAQFESTDAIYVTVAGNLRVISLKDKTVQASDIVNIADFKAYKDQIVYVTTSDENNECEIRLYHAGDNKSVLVQTVSADKSSVEATITRYSGQSYLAFFIDNRLFVYRSQEFPRGSQKISLMVKIAEHDASITPNEDLIVSPNGAVIIARNNNKMVAFDNEMEVLSEYEYSSYRTVWFDDYILSDVSSEGELLVRDFDGANLRRLTLHGTVAGYAQFISANNKYFYYIAKTDKGELVLRRENLE